MTTPRLRTDHLAVSYGGLLAVSDVSIDVGAGELVTLFWSDEIFDQARPDTYFRPVLPAREAS